MADDIDIEEHDVLESLRRRQAPPAAVKTEPLDPEYDSHYEDSQNFEYQWDWEKGEGPEIKVEPAEEFQFGKIILGSKPATPPPEECGQEIPGDSQDLQERQDNYNYNMSLVLDDWGPMLERSDCYCKECQILYATVNALDAHKMIAHSFLVAMDKESSPERNKAIKSTAKPSNSDVNQTCEICHYYFKGTAGRFNLLRHYRQVHQVDPATLKNIENFKNWRLCNHCNMYFPDDTSLVKHLYELLPLNNKTPTKDDRKSVGQSGVKAKQVLNVDKNNSKAAASKDIKPTNVKDVKSSNADVPSLKVKDVNSVNKQANRIILGSKSATVKESDEYDSPGPIKRKCEICSIEYNRKYYWLHMRKFHQDYLPKKREHKVDLCDKNVKYKCLICHDILETEYSLRKHREKHAGSKGKRIYAKLVVKTKGAPVIKKEPVKVVKKEPKVVKKEILEEESGILVSKSTIFKCNRCSVHFLTCTGACQHSIVCESSSNIRDWACPQCQRVFKNIEKSAHEYQHKMMNANKFKVYVVYLEMIVRILCECPDCYVCFEEDKFWKHVNSGCRCDADSYYCNECRLPIDLCSKANHDSKHTQGDFTKDDFIKIDYVSSKRKIKPKIKTEIFEDPAVKNEIETPKRSLKRKLEMDEVPKKRKQSNNTDMLQLYYCTTCKTHFAHRVQFHVEGKCNMKKPRSLCKLCGVFLSVKNRTLLTHRAMHEKNPHLTVSDFTFFRMSDSKRIKPVQEIFPCKKCHVNFLSKWCRLRHSCTNTVHVKCLICQKKIDKKTFKIHMQFHNYVIPGNVKTVNQKLTQNVARPSGHGHDTTPMRQTMRKETMSSITKMPDLLMKYESLTALWNILYLCDTCDTFTDSYDKVVEHCQNHLTNMENYGVVIMKCQICDMKFDSECYRRHLELHAGSKVISKKTFQILKYKYFNLFSDQWFDFIDLPEQQKSQIVNRSIYGANRCVKMRLVQQGPPEYTLYKCCKCLNCVAPDNIVYHVKLAQCVKANKIACPVCDMTFAIRAQCEEHENIHNVTKLGVESFRIVTFNEASDVESNMKIMSYDTENHGSKNKISFTDNGVLPKVTKKDKATSKSFVFYKCAQCHQCLMYLTSFKYRHKCSDSQKLECSKCGLNFGATYLSFHKRLHNKYKFSRNNVVVKTVNKDGQVINIKKQIHENTSAAAHSKFATEVKPKLFKCYCGLHFTSLKSIEKHYKMKNCSTVVREKCSQCNLVFDPIEVVNHLCKHHAKNQINSFSIVTPNKKTLYKCSLCHVLFYSKEAAVPHKYKCIGKFCGKKCDKCGLAFDATSLATHMVDHERNNKLRTDCYVIVKIPEDTMLTIDRKLSPNTLYKCNTCDIHFIRRTSCRNHLTQGRHGGRLSISKCKICRLTFFSKSLPKHVAWHHNKLKIKEFDVKELVVGVNTKVPKDASEAVTPKVNKIEQLPKVKPVKVAPKPIERQVTVFKCVKCAVHFTEESSLVNHHEDRCSKELSEECEDCAVKFASRDIKAHRKLHGFGVTLTMNIVKDSTLRKEEKIKKETVMRAHPPERCNKIYKCTVCNRHYNSKRTFLLHPENCRTTTCSVECTICNINFTKKSLSTHMQLHQRYKYRKDDFVVLTWDNLNSSKLEANKEEVDDETEQVIEEDTSLDTSSELETKKSDTVKSKAKDPVKESAKIHLLYKCADCNVYFVTQRACHKHIAKHTPLDSKDYIECKLCGFQFTIMTLQTHIKKHHAEQFNLEEVLVEEYRPDDIKHNESYYASEKDQSRLVSTSDDINNVSNLNVENDSEVTSCNEIMEKVESAERNIPTVIIMGPEAKSDEGSNHLTMTEANSSNPNINDKPVVTE